MRLKPISNFLLSLLIVACLGLGCSGPEDKREDFIQKARAKIEEQNYVEARLDLKNALKVDPESAEAHALLGRSELALGHIRQGVSHLNRAVELDPNQLQARVSLAGIMLQAGQTDKAEEHVQAVLAEEPDNIQARIVLAGLQAKSGQSAEAIQTLHKVITEAPQESSAYLNLSRILQSLDRQEEASQILEQALDTLPEQKRLRLELIKALTQLGKRAAADEHFLHLLEKDPENSSLQLGYASYLQQTNRSDRAVQVLQKLVKAHPNEESYALALAQIQMQAQNADQAVETLQQGIQASESKAFALRIALAELYIGQDRIEAALKLLQETVNLDKKAPAALQARQMLARIYMSQGQYEMAETEIASLIELSPDDRAGHLLRGRLLLAQDNAAQAVIELRQALTRENIQTYMYLARAHFANEEPQNGFQVLHEALENNPDFLPARQEIVRYALERDKSDMINAQIEYLQEHYPNQGRVQLFIGDVYLKQEQYDQALKAYAQAAGLEGFQAAAAVKIAELELAKGNSDKALQEVKKAIALRPEELSIYQRLAGMYIQSGAIKEGITYFEEAEQSVEETTGISFLLAMLYQIQGRMDDARKRYESLLEVYPDFLPAANNLAFLIAESSRDRQELERALSLVQKHVETGQPDVLDTLGWIYHKLGQREMALKYIRQAISKNPGNPEYQQHLQAVLQGSSEKN